MTDITPLIQLEKDGSAPELKYSVPEPTSYYGSQLIELNLSKDVFKQKYSDRNNYPISDLSEDEISAEISEYNGTGRRPRLSPITRASPRSVGATRGLVNLSVDEVLLKDKNGLMPVLVKSMSGKVSTEYIKKPEKPEPTLFLVERYKLSSHLGDYGAGRVIKTMTLLPGEKTKIHVKTYKKSESTSKSASSILDSFTEESAEEFEASVLEEQSSTEKKDKAFEYYADASVNQSWGMGSASVDAGVSGSTNSSREDFAKNVTNATDKHSMKASAKRDVSIETSYEVKEESGEERSIERSLENINVSRTLNFIFRQMNQKYYTFLSLVDVRVGFFNGFEKKEVSIGELDQLLEEYCVDEAAVNSVRDSILIELQSILDESGNRQSLLELIEGQDDINGHKMSSYWRVNNDLATEYIDEVTGYQQTVKGILLKTTSNVMRTDGIIVESLLGTGESLDNYNHKLQNQAVQSSILENQKLKLAIDIVKGIEDPLQQAEAFKTMFQQTKNDLEE